MPTDMVRAPARAPVAERMVDRRTGRTWTVDVDAFEIATTVVTVEQWNALLGTETEPSRADFPKIEVSCAKLSRSATSCPCGRGSPPPTPSR